MNCKHIQSIITVIKQQQIKVKADIKIMIKISRLLITKPVSIQIQNKLTSMATETNGPVAQAITAALSENFQPVHLEVINESYMHNVPKGAETHFKVLVVSEKFDELQLIKRHRLVNQVVKEKLADHFPHALSIDAKTPKQWEPTYNVEPSPNCRGGFGK